MDNFCTLRKVFSRLLRKECGFNESNKETSFLCLENLGLDPDWIRIQRPIAPDPDSVNIVRIRDTDRFIIKDFNSVERTVVNIH
jgi:hypothetical protein